MAVTPPVARAAMELDIAHPEGAVDFHLGVEKIRTGVTVMQAGVDDLDRRAVGRGKRCDGKEAVLPGIVQKFFHSCDGWCRFDLQRYVFSERRPTPPHGLFARALLYGAKKRPARKSLSPPDADNFKDSKHNGEGPRRAR